jgi:GntR family transcriptional regulator/MocR family aminotransferase
LTLRLEAPDHLPVYVRLARGITSEILRGRLPRGTRLPGSRPLARQLRLHRNTVLAAYRELIAEGWITCERARGTFVSLALPAAVTNASRAVYDRVGYPLHRESLRPAPTIAPGGRALISIDGGVPDLRLAPLKPFLRAYRRAVLARRGEALSYPALGGDGALTRALGDMLAQVRGLPSAPERLLVTRGAQGALHLLAMTLVRPGDLWAVEDPGYFFATEALRLAGAKVVPIAVDDEGLRVDALEPWVRRGLKGVFTTPQHQYPTMVGLSAPRRLALLKLARRHRLAIIEDDFDHEFHYESRPALPLASTDASGQVVYVGSLSKVFAPGIRLGYIWAPPPLTERLARRQTALGLECDATTTRAVAELFDEGEIQRHFYRMRRVYLERRDAQASALQRELGGVLSFAVPRGGMATWASVDRSIDVEAWLESARARGLLFQTGRRYFFDQRPHPFVRLGFSSMSPAEMREAVKRLAATLPASGSARRDREPQ